MSSTMAGTRKADTGRSRSTAAEPGVRAEAGEEPPAQPAAERARDEERPAGRGERRGGQEAEAEPRRRHPVGRREAAVPHDDSLRAAGGPRGVHDVGHVVGAEGRLQVPVVGGQQVGPAQVDSPGAGAHHGSDSGPDLVDDLAAQGDGRPGVARGSGLSFDRAEPGQQRAPPPRRPCGCRGRRRATPAARRCR